MARVRKQRLHNSEAQRRETHWISCVSVSALVIAQCRHVEVINRMLPSPHRLQSRSADPGTDAFRGVLQPAAMEQRSKQHRQCAHATETCRLYVVKELWNLVENLLIAFAHGRPLRQRQCILGR